MRIHNSMKSVIVFFWVKNVLSDFVDFVIHNLKLWLLSYRKYPLDSQLGPILLIHDLIILISNQVSAWVGRTSC